MSLALPKATLERGERPRSLNRLLVVKLVYGAALLAAAPLLPRQAGRLRVGTWARCATGAIGARNLVEAAIIYKRPTTATITAAAAIDATHATSMLVLAVARPSRWRLATASGVPAGLLAGAALAAAHRLSSDSPCDA